jgi:hypothetical protein
LPSGWNALDVLVIDQPMPVNEHVPLLKRHEQTLPCVAVDQCEEPESRVFIEEIVGIVQPLEHAASGVPQHVDVGRYPLLELAPSEDLEEGDRALDRVGGDVAEDARGTRLLTRAWGSETQPTLCDWVGSKLAHSVRQRIRRGPKLTGEKLTSTRSI